MPIWKLRVDRAVQHLRRYRHIMGVLMKYGLAEMGGALSRRARLRLGPRAVPLRVKASPDGRTRPERVRLALEELGPTFVKLGQILSTRPDLVPPEYVEELERLQDRVPPEKFSRIKAEVERELGAPLEELFARFEPEPIAGGSIAQVHQATTRDGRRVAVKVRRPGIVQTLRTECEILETMAGLISMAQSGQDSIDPQRMVREFTRALAKETDLANERRNQLRFLRNFAGDPAVHVPAVYEELCTEGVLTMEYIDGIKASNLDALRSAGLDPSVVAARGADFVLKQIFELGFFHTDPHPGNFFVLPGNVLVPLDFGQAAGLTSRDRAMLAELVMAIVEHDVAHLVHKLNVAGMLGERTDPDELVREAEALLDAYHNLPLRDIPFGPVIREGFDLMRRHHVRAPTEFTLMLKSLMTIESLANTLDSNFEILEHLRPQARRFQLQQFNPRRIVRNLRQGMRDLGELAGKLPEDLEALLSKFRHGTFQVRVHHEHLENLATTLDKSSNRISFSLIIAALLMGSSMLVSQPGTVFDVGLQTLGVLGYFVAAAMGLWLLVSIIRSRRL